MMSRLPKKIKKKTVAIADSIARNVPSRRLSQPLKEYFSVAKSFPGAATQDISNQPLQGNQTWLFWPLGQMILEKTKSIGYS